MATLTDIAKGVLNELNAGAWPIPFTAVRSYLPRPPLEDLEGILVTVLVRGVDLAIESRSKTRSEYTVPVLVQKRVTWDTGDADQDEMEELLTLCEQLADHFLTLAFDEPAAVCVAIEQDPAFLPEHLESHEFAAVLMTTWRLWR